jgi:chemotaxis protein MotA
MQQLVGILIVLGAVFGGFAMMGGTLHQIWQPIEVLVIAGAGLGAIVLGNPMHVLHEMVSQIKKIATRKGTTRNSSASCCC